MSDHESDGPAGESTLVAAADSAAVVAVVETAAAVETVVVPEWQVRAVEVSLAFKLVSDCMAAGKFTAAQTVLDHALTCMRETTFAADVPNEPGSVEDNPLAVLAEVVAIQAAGLAEQNVIGEHLARHALKLFEQIELVPKGAGAKATASILINAGIALRCSGCFEEAMPLLTRGTEAADKESEPAKRRMQLVFGLVNLAGCARRVEREGLLLDTISRLQSVLFLEDDADQGDPMLLGFAGGFYSGCERFNDAISCFEKARQILAARLAVDRSQATLEQLIEMLLQLRQLYARTERTNEMGGVEAILTQIGFKVSGDTPKPRRQYFTLASSPDPRRFGVH